MTTSLRRKGPSSRRCSRQQRTGRGLCMRSRTRNRGSRISAEPMQRPCSTNFTRKSRPCWSRGNPPTSSWSKNIMRISRVWKTPLIHGNVLSTIAISIIKAEAKTLVKKIHLVCVQQWLAGRQILQRQVEWKTYYDDSGRDNMKNISSTK